MIITLYHPHLTMLTLRLREIRLGSFYREQGGKSSEYFPSPANMLKVVLALALLLPWRLMPTTKSQGKLVNFFTK